MPRLLFVHAYALYTTLKNTVLSSFFFFFFFCFKSHIQSFFFLAVYPPPPLPKHHLYKEPINIHQCTGGEGGAERRRGAGGIPPPYQSTSKWLVWTWKAVSRNWFKFHLYYTQEKKDRKEKGVAWKMKLRYKLKLEGCFFFFVSLSHSYWPPRILLYNGLSTSFFFFYYNIIYLNFLLTKQNPGSTDQRCNRRSALCVFLLLSHGRSRW